MIELDEVSFSYKGASEQLKEINLKVSAGECVVLCGRSGSGKTTLTRVVNGLAPAYYEGELSGSVSIDGVSAAMMPQWERALTVGSVFQDPRSQFFSSELCGEIAFGCENSGFTHEEIKSRTDLTIQMMGLSSLKTVPLDVLSSGQKQRVAIASVYAMEPSVYTFDEPSANLDEQGSLELSQLMRQLKSEGKTLIVAEHRLAYLADIADRYVYIDGGSIAYEFAPHELAALSEQRRKALGLRSLCLNASELRTANYVQAQHGIGVRDLGEAPSLELRGIGKKLARKTLFSSINLKVSSGEVLALTGKNGIGKSTLMRIAAGLEKESAGKVLIKGARVKKATRCKAVWYSSNDTNTQFFCDSVESELLLLSPRDDDTLQKAREILKRLDLYQYKDRHPATLSGGQRLRLSLASGILSERSVLIFDEPTSGLDGANLLLVADLLNELAACGKAIVVITHDEELIEACKARVLCIS